MAIGRDPDRAAALQGLADCLEGAAPIVRMMNATDASRARHAGDAQTLAIHPSALERSVGHLRGVAESTPSAAIPGATGVALFLGGDQPLEFLHVFAPALRAGWPCILAGNPVLRETNITLMKFIHAVLEGHALPVDACIVDPAVSPDKHPLWLEAGFSFVVGGSGITDTSGRPLHSAADFARSLGLPHAAPA